MIVRSISMIMSMSMSMSTSIIVVITDPSGVHAAAPQAADRGWDADLLLQRSGHQLRVDRSSGFRQFVFYKRRADRGPQKCSQETIGPPTKEIHLLDARLLEVWH